IVHPLGSLAFERAFEGLERGLRRLPARALEPGALWVSSVPRDGALALAFDDLLDEGSLRSAVAVLAGDPPIAPFNARVLLDPSHGDVAYGRFRSTRVLIDLEVSPQEALASGADVNAGLPPASSAGSSNARLLLRAEPGLRNLSGRTLAEPLEWSFRSISSGTASETAGGGASALSGAGPRILGQQAVSVLRVVPKGGSEFVVAWQYAQPACALRAGPGDALEFSGAVVEVIPGATPPIYGPAPGLVRNVRVMLVMGSASSVVPGPAQFVAAFDPAQGDPPECFVRFQPAPLAPPNHSVSTSASVLVRFSEPIDPASVQALDTFAISRPAGAPPLARDVVGTVSFSVLPVHFVLAPSLPLAHAAGQAEVYGLRVVGGPNGIRGLSGLPLEEGLTSVFSLDPAEPAVSTSSLALGFSSVDEDGDGAPEVRGQFLYDLAKGLIRPRPVSRFSAVADSAGAPTMAAMVPSIAPIVPPLSMHGSRLMSVWRYHDLGFTLLDEVTHNLDVEGLAWAPAVSPQPDAFSGFQMALAHSAWLPDEWINTALLPGYPFSGLTKTFAEDPLESPSVVHPKTAGYVIDPSQAFAASTGTLMMPWPLNQGVPPAQHVFWTWRDTSIQALAGLKGVGADTRRLVQVTGYGFQGFYPAGQVPTIGLPLLTEFRTHPDPNALELNAFKVAFAINSSALPAFRAYSAGGVTPTGVKLIDPDNEPIAQGGISPSGGATTPIDNSVYFGQVDFVVRVSRAHTVWLDTQAAAPSFAPAVVEPTGLYLPPGTQVALAFRGADGFSSPGLLSPWRDARNVGPYGESYTPAQLTMLGKNTNLSFTPAFLNGDAGWKSALSQVDGARFVQVRITFVSNAATLEEPHLSGLGLAFGF
ncbi:MAG TPA: hypothetical protein VMS76_15275, partial [Planctomycetota bacterium]|nr:hypothetical protein [Planctomycetota bacterium]